MIWVCILHHEKTKRYSPDTASYTNCSIANPIIYSVHILTRRGNIPSFSSMIIVLEQKITEEKKQHIRQFLENRGYRVKEIIGDIETIFGAVGVPRVDIREVEVLDGVAKVIPITRPYKLASRELNKQDTVVSAGSIKIGGKRIAVIAGPCAIESREQIFAIAEKVSQAGAVMLRGGAFKPRTSPYDFQGLGVEGIKYMKEAGEAFGLPITTEIVNPQHTDMMREYVDVFQIGARNMQNFELLKEVGKTGLPVILKRGLAATIEEWLMAAEYLMAHGTDDVILCERGIRTFERYTRNTLDLSAIPVVKKLSHLPIIVDPSHATGLRGKVLPMGLAAVAAGADGIMVEVHTDPDNALSDGAQSLYPEQFEKLMRDIEALAPVLGKSIEYIPKKAKAVSAALELKDKQAEHKVAFQGVRGAYSEAALKAYFREDKVPLPCRGFSDVFKTVLRGEARYGIIPVENSLAGVINENLDLLLSHPDIRIIGEQDIRIVHSLIGMPGSALETIRKVYSHPQGLAQCSVFLDNLPEVERIPFFDTAGAVAHLAELNDPSSAAIAGVQSAECYGMEILKEGIETNPRNYTRFYIIARDTEADKMLEIQDANRAIMVFSTADEPGALFRCLKVLAERGLNMKKLESRPIHGKPWEYMFFIETEIPGTEAYTQAIKELVDVTVEFRILGEFSSNR